MKILLATDFTEASDNAISYVLQLAKQWKTKELSFVLVHAFKPLVPYTKVPSMPVIHNDTLEEQLRQKFEQLIEKLSQQVEIKGYFKKGSLVNVINDLALEASPDLLVMGTREKSSFERMTVGTNTLQVARNCTIPILAIPIEASFSQMKQVAITTDLEPVEVQYENLLLFKEMLSISNANLTVMHVFKEGKLEDLSEQISNTAMHRYLEDTPHDHIPVVNENTFEGIRQFLDEKKPDLLAAIPRDRNFLEKIFHKSTTEQIAYHTQIPLLILV